MYALCAANTFILTNDEDDFPEVELKEPERFVKGNNASFLQTRVKIAFPEDYVCETQEEKDKLVAGIRKVEVSTLYEYVHKRSD